MHALKVSLSGQTFAQAKRHDSHGKKSRIRRTKEERRTMVESFINEYRTSNKGKFPSLSLTHKEVGGSFYTVREIVRELIQENKVLGPATLTSGEHRADNFSEQYVSNSLSAEPHGHLSSSEIGHAVDHVQNESLAIANDVQSMCEGATVSNWDSLSRCYEMVESEDTETIKSLSNDIYIPHFVHEEGTDQKQNLYDGRYMNGNEECKVEETVEPSDLEKFTTQEDELRRSEVLANNKFDDEIGKKNNSTGGSTSSSADGEMVFFESVESDSTSEANSVMNKETSNISVLIDDQSSATTSNHSLSEGLTANAMTGMLQSQETNLPAGKMELPSDLLTSDAVPSADMSSNAVDVKTEKETVTSFSSRERTPTNGLSTHKISTLSEGTGLISGISHADELDWEAYNQKSLRRGAELQPCCSPNDSRTEKPASDGTTDSICGESFSSEADRISSGSSEKATVEPAVAGETNPILVAIKAFITAFVKFWVE